MIFSSFFRALGQIGDPAFRSVMAKGVALSLGLLIAAYIALSYVLGWITPDSMTLPLVGTIDGIGALVSVASVLLMLGLSVFLMVPVASAFTGLFLEQVADAVESRHYPTLPDVRPIPLGESLIGSINFLGVVIAVNLLALVLWPFAGPLVPVLFWVVNGYLLGREYFTLVAARRSDAATAKQMWRANKAKLWAAGTLMAAPLSIPLVNLLIPVLGVATFTHIYHAIAARRAA